MSGFVKRPTDAIGLFVATIGYGIGLDGGFFRLDVSEQLLFCRQFGAGRRFDLVPTRANGQPAFGAYLRVPAGIRHATGFYVLTLAGDRICAMTRFEASVLPWFGLPRSLPAR